MLKQLSHCVIALALAAIVPSANASDVREWQFKVFLDDREIGYHDYKVVATGDSLTVDSNARFDVKILFVNAFRYRHQTVETWNANCLAGIDAETTANGEEFIVRGGRAGSEFLLDTGDSEVALPPCIMTFAYWNPEMLKADRLLNAQTGEYETIEVTQTRRDTLEINGEKIAADRYELGVKGRPITLWYATDDQRWLALESVAKGGRILRYAPVSLPDAATVRLARAADTNTDA